MIKAAIFDKDGTLFDFRSSWGAWMRVMLAEVARTPAEAQDLAQRLGFDQQSGAIAASSIVIAHTNDEIAQEIVKVLPHHDLAALIPQLESLAKSAPMMPVADLPAVFGALRAAGLKIGLATNDAEIPARHHLQEAGILPLFDFVAGYDSGWGGKPAPGQLLAFAAACGLPADQIAMVGDSVHDLVAAQNAGMARVAVLTGIAVAADLAPHAEVVLPDISGLLDWIAQKNAL